MTLTADSSRFGEGTAWVVVDRAADDYACYWYTGEDDQDLVEEARAPNVVDAVAWGRHRTPRVRVRTANSCTYSVDEIPDMVSILGPTGRLQYTNPAGQQLLGHDFAALGEHTEELVHPNDVHVLRSAMAQLVATPGCRLSFEYRMVHADGTWRHLETFGTNLAEDPRIRGIVLHSHDVTERRDAEDQLEYERLHDHLTGFPTRLLITEQLARALRRTERLGHPLAVFGVNIDGLSQINDVHGFDAGDALVVRVGRDLDALMRAYDSVARTDSMVGRLEDAFFVVCEGVADARTAAVIARRLADAVREGPDGDDLSVSATIGVVLSGPDSTPDTLLLDATSALEVGKALGGDRVEFFDETIRQEAEQRAADEQALGVAIATGQLHLVYQPQIDITTGEVRGVEALVRWDHPERGTLPPSEFIGLAEDSGLIVSLGEWVLREACRQRAVWSPAVGSNARFRMCVNVSSHQFSDTFHELVRRVLTESGVPADVLCLEITESAIMGDLEAAIVTMHQLQHLGVEMSIDDFGTGYASLAQLKRLPFDELKIDQSFIDGLEDNREDRAIVTAIIAVAHALDLSVIAEGVETEAQLAQLRALGCELAQGYLFARPASAADIDRLLAER